METEIPLEALADRLGRKMGIDADSTEGAMLNWSATYTGQTGDLLLSTGSTDQSGNYVFELRPQRVNSSAGEKIPYWSAADGNDTMFSLWNPGSTTQNVVLTFYSADGMHSYAMPIALAPMASTMVDVAMDLARMRGTPDASGNTLPSDVQSGSAMLEPAGIPEVGPNGKILMPKTGPPEMQVVASVGIFNVTTATCGGLCMDCCFYDCAYVDASPVNVGTTISATFYVEDCCGVWWDDTSYASWSSSDPSIATSNGGGSFNTVGAGTVDLEAQILMHAQDPNNYHCIDSCGDGWVVGNFDVPVAPVITSVTPNAILAGKSASIAISGNGFGSTPTINLPSAFTLSGQSSGNTAISGTLAIATGATLGNNNITVTANGVTSAGFNLIADYPSQIYVTADSTVLCGGCSTTVQRNVNYVVQLFSGATAPSGLGLEEGIATSNWTCTTPTSDAYTTCASGINTNSDGAFADGWSLGTGTISPVGCGFDILDHYEWCPTGKTIATVSGNISQTSIKVCIGSACYTSALGAENKITG